MSMSRKVPPGLYAQLETLPEYKIGEIISGTVYVHPRLPTVQCIAKSNLGMDLNERFGFRRGRWRIVFEVEVHLGPNVVVPTISGWTAERWPKGHDAFTTVRPDWLCEVLMPSTRGLVRDQKLTIYAEHGAPFCWLLDPLEKTLEVFVLHDGAYQIGPTFQGDMPVTAPPFAAQAFELGLLWEP